MIPFCMNMQQVRSHGGNQSPNADNGKRPPGRPRSEHARSAILGSTLRLLEQTGFDGLSIEAIAADASVGKATVYRWWPNKGALVADAFESGSAKQLRFPDTGSVREDLREQMSQWARILRGRRGRIVAAIIAAGQSDKELIEAFRERFVRPRRLDACEILRRGIRRGELPRDADLDLILDSLYGAVYMRFLIWQKGLTEDFVREVVDLILFNTAESVSPRRWNGRRPAGSVQKASALAR